MVLDDEGTDLSENKTPELDEVQAKTEGSPDKLLKLDLKVEYLCSEEGIGRI